MITQRYGADGKIELLLNQVQKCALYDFELELETDRYTWQEYDCDCGTQFKDLRLIADKDRYGMKIQTRICPKCGLIMTNPRMTQISYNNFYDQYYRKIYVGRKYAEEIYFQRQRAHGKRIYDYIDQNYGLDKITSVLEIGCGAGGILSYFKEQGVETVKGIDLGSEYVQFGIKHNLDLENCAAETIISQGKKYDLIILSHVIEHFLDIKKELNSIRRLLSEKGIIYVEVPGIKSIPDDYHNNFLEYLQNAHLRHFTLDTLKQLMSWNGYTCLSGNDKVQSIFAASQEQNQIHSYYQDIMDYLEQHEEEYQKTTSQELTRYKRMANKAENISEIFNAWMNLNRQGLKIDEYLGKKSVQTVAIYGYGILGRQLYQELKDTGVKVDYIIDRKDVNEGDVRCLHPEDPLQEVDLVIMTVVDDYIQVYHTLHDNFIVSQNKAKVIPLAEILLDMYEKVKN